MEVLITGAEGFIGKNLRSLLETETDTKVVTYTKSEDKETLRSKVASCDVLIHLAGVNRPKVISEHNEINYNLTKEIICILEEYNKCCDIIFTSSVQASLDNPYGISKKAAEDLFLEYRKKMNTNVYIYRLPNLFGKWAKPNYNSVVATFCYNISRNISIEIHDAQKEIEFLYIDDLIMDIVSIIKNRPVHESTFYPNPMTYKMTVGEVAKLIYSFQLGRTNLLLPQISNAFIKKLYSTYLSYLPLENFKYGLVSCIDHRGSFTEFLKMKDFGQLSINVSKPGVLKGNHWHKTKVEKFLVVKGEAKISLQCFYTNDTVDYYVDDKKYEIVDIPPGYSHVIENVGTEDLVTIIWANEIYSKNNPDTYKDFSKSNASE